MAAPHSTRIDELLPAYALGALEGDELRELEEHLASGCPECRRQLDLLQGDLEAFAASFEPIAPSEMVRQRVLRDAKPAAAPESAPEPRLQRPAPAPRWGWLAAAAALVFAILAGWGLAERARLQGEAQALAAERDSLSRRAAELSREAESARTAAARMSRALEIISSPGMQSVALAGLGPTPGATGRTFIDPLDGKAVFYAFDLPKLAADKTYELWFITADGPVAAGTFDVDPRGAASLEVPRTVPAGGIAAWAVTIEPAGGVQQPTGDMVLKG
jgi:anti-sigma-K factor RskA